MKIGVFHVILSPGGGAWSVVRELATWQSQKLPIAVGISYKESGPTESLREAKELDTTIFYHKVPVEFPNSSAILLPPLKKWYRALKSIDGSVNWVTHFHNGMGVGFAFWPSISSRARYPFPSINTFHGIPPEDVVIELRKRIGSIQTKINGFLARKMNRMGIQLIALSNASRAEIADVYRIPEESVKVIFNGVPAGLNEAGLRLYKRDRTLPFIVGFVGHIGKNKRWDIAIEAVAKLKAEGKNIRLLIAGSGPELERLKRAVKPFCPFVEYLGMVPKASTVLMPLLDSLVLPTHHEGQPMVILEAMACGVPTIATEVGAIPETIEHGKTGYLIKLPSSSSELADYLRRLVDNPDLHLGMRKKCIEEWRERFSVEAMGSEYLRAYESVLLK